MAKLVAIKPRWLQAISFWAGADHYPLHDALQAKEFRLPVERVSRVYRIDFGALPGLGSLNRYVIAYRSEHRDCMVVLDSLPGALAGMHLHNVRPSGAMRLFLSLLLREPSATLTLLVIFAPMVFGLFFFLFWINFVLRNHELMGVIANQSCDALCVEKVLKIHSIVGVVFITPLVMVLLPIGLMIFKMPRYKVALNYRLAQSFCIVSLCVGVIFLAQQLAIFPFKNYGRFVMSGFGPQAVSFLKDRGLKKQ